MTNNKLIELLNEIENEETLKVITIIQGNILLSSIINDITNAEELRIQMILEFGEKFFDLIKNQTKICWNQILWFFNEYKKIN